MSSADVSHQEALPILVNDDAGQMTLVFNISIVPRWFDPAESEGLVTPFIFYYAIHDALVKPRRAATLWV